MYKSFVLGVVNLSQENKQIFARTAKDVLDEGYESQLKQWYGHDEKTLRRHSEDSKTKDAKQLWESLQKRFTYMALAPEVAPNIVQRLKLPTVGSDPRNRRGKGTSNDQWVFQSYADFASKAEKRNSEVEFDKTLMDVAFRYQVNKVVPLSPKKRAGPNGGPSLEKMLTRCLGRESDDYWEGREKVPRA